MPSVRIATAVLLGLLGGYIIVGNLWLILRWVLWRKHGSLIPLLGGLSATAALTLGQVGPPAVWWLPVAVDPGCLLLAILTGIAWVRR